MTKGETMMLILELMAETLRQSFHLLFMSQLRDFSPIQAGPREEKDINCVYGLHALCSKSGWGGDMDLQPVSLIPYLVN